MSEEILVRHCSPTLAGLKTASLFACRFADAGEMERCIDRWNGKLARKGIRVLSLRYQAGSALIYVYRPFQLARDLHRGEARALLGERGYAPGTSEQHLCELMRRLSEQEEFPHEIGLFLGYPPEDVWGFIEHEARDYKCVGCWKVYGDEAAAQKLFARYQKCTDIYCALFARGRSIERLAVAV